MIKHVSYYKLQAKDKDVVAILDPPRAGIGKKVISTLRLNDKIESLVFISCDSANNQAQGNIVDLCRETSNKLPNEPFR